MIVTGGRNSPSFFGNAHLPTIILEAELDAILVQQIAGDICSCMSVPAGNKIDAWADEVLRSGPQLIFAMDFDDGGKNAFKFWKKTYPQIKPWPVPREKSPGDAH